MGDDRNIPTPLKKLLQTAGKHTKSKENGGDPIDDLVSL
jgi:hypothetical protein